MPDKPNDLWQDMQRLSGLYEELMWSHDTHLEFIPDYENNQIIIRPDGRKMGS
tara:strand:+ start:1208 stop:1366 length:159 start_codon:yes stop_codon:yes gene_type:complete